jgi:mRNA-degrading endonuclease toxin of MazEF toxin-antitoxin module
LAPERGEVWLVDFGITQKVRPALVISVPYGDSDRALLGVIPHTTATRGSQNVRRELGNGARIVTLSVTLTDKSRKLE